jgi:hypothetical protein
VRTGGEGAVSGQEVRFIVNFTSPITLDPDHYFFIPQVGVSSGEFFWLSAPAPTATGDLQSWIRNGNLDPDWLRIGTDIIGGGVNAPKFNAAFALSGETVAAVPGPVAGAGLPGLVPAFGSAVAWWRRRHQAA